jgi:hypothetical protein
MFTRDDLLSFLRSQRLAVQASVSSALGPQAAVVAIVVTDQFEIIFDTLSTTRKAQNLRQNSRIALVIGGLVAGDERTAQVEGLADEPTGEEHTRVKDVYLRGHPKGIERLSWPNLMYVRVRPTWVRYSDYNQNPPEIVEFTF